MQRGSKLTSLWSGINIYTLTDTGWTNALEKGGFSVHGDFIEGEKFPVVEVDKKRKGYVKITYNGFYDEKMDIDSVGEDFYWDFVFKVKHKWVPLTKVKK